MKRDQQASPRIALVEVTIAVAIMAAGLIGYIPFSSVPCLLAAATFFLWWRGPGWKGVGLAFPVNAMSIVFIGAAVGVGYQFLGLYVIEPLLARLTTGKLPDVSVFRALIGDERQLAFWLAISWTLAAFMEEMVYRGWLITRLAELTNFSQAGWVLGAVVSSILFGAVHLYQGVSGIIASGLAGIVFASVYLLTSRNLWGPIFAHGVMDTVGFVMIYFGVYPGL